MRFFVLALMSILLAGCLGGFGYATVTTTRPPAPYVEIVGTAPGPQYVWVDGYWWWNGNDYIWVRGHWGIPPGPTYVYRHGGWVYDDGSYVYVHGRWVRPGTPRRAVYVHRNRPSVRVVPGASYRTTVRGGNARVRAR